jgi:hypothetical protein
MFLWKKVHNDTVVLEGRCPLSIKKMFKRILNIGMMGLENLPEAMIACGSPRKLPQKAP